jgi:heme/copper-type cytochrome/quinol oxidase subunit 2
LNVAAVGAFHPSHVISPVVIVVIVIVVVVIVVVVIVVVVVEYKAAYQRDAFCGVWVLFRS